MEKIAVVDFVHLTITYEEEPNMKVATDIGGTFTDLVAIDENGSLILDVYKRQLLGCDGLAELDALLGIAQRVLKRALGDAQGLRSDADASAVQRLSLIHIWTGYWFSKSANVLSSTPT